MNRTTLASACLALLALQAEASAQTAPAPQQTPAQRADRYYDQREAPTQPQAPTDPLPASTPAPAAVRSDVRFTLTGVTFDKSAWLDEPTLQQMAQPYIGHEVGATELNALLDAINAEYAKRGISTARAVLGAQGVGNGVVHVALIEGHLGKVKVQGVHRTKEAFVQRRIHAVEGELLDTNALRNDLTYLNRTTDVRAAALLQPGASRGLTDVLVDVTEPATRSFDAFVDNAGVDTSGTTRVGVAGHVNGLLGVSDRMDLNIAHASGGTDGQFSYSGIVSPSNGRLGISYARSQIDIVNGPYRDLDIVGHSSVAALDFTQPFIANQRWLFEGTAAYTHARSSTDIAGTSVADTTTNGFGIGILLNHRTEGREWTLTQQVSHLSASQPIADSGSFLTATGSFDGVQAFGKAWALRLGAGWQYSNKDTLPSSSLFQLGGVGSVRGYDRGVVAGARGYFLDLELHRPIGAVDTYAFADHGAVFAAFPRNRQITGAGLGANWNYRRWLTFTGDVAHAFTRVVPDQDAWRVDFRLAVHWE
ncbi:ShlB/FhaC/HecB family hemolysin secretion/activation protein [Luteibacter sp.]|uniref:ShlB/FhaC/HecB family hemolysin secretion/activation protein n=1 Tax=Luteibacter sp. TaxID=1886636 RepID=UPI003F81ABD5